MRTSNLTLTALANRLRACGVHLLPDLVQARVWGRGVSAGTGPATALDKAALRALLGITSTPGADAVPLVDGTANRLLLSWLETTTAAGDHSVLCTNAAGATSWVRSTNERSSLIRKGSSDPFTVSRWAGSSFPTSPVNGQTFFHDTHRCEFEYSTAGSGWLSTELWGFDFGINADLASPNFLKYAETAASLTFTSAIGYPRDFACKVVDMCLSMGASGTCTVSVGNGATAITGADLALSSQQSKSDSTLLSATIAAGSILTVAVTSGTIKGQARGKFWIRRFET